MDTNFEKGRYESMPTDFTKFDTIKFVPHMYDPSIFGISGCGPSALSLISGMSPKVTTKLQEDDGSLDPNNVEKFLTENKFTFCKLTLAKLTNSPINAHNQIENVVRPYHVLLLIQLYQKNIASYTVVWNNLIWHNFSIQPLTPLELVNRPIIGGWILCHESWK